jgi:pectate lyase
MKKLLSTRLATVVLLSCAVTAGCAGQQAKDSASPQARQAIQNAADAISIANRNNWMWRDTEDLFKQAQAAASNGQNGKAIDLANEARFQAEAATIQYNYEKDHPRGQSW